MDIPRRRQLNDILSGLFLLSHPGPVALHIVAVAVFALLAAWPHVAWGIFALIVGAHAAMQISIAMLNDYCDRRMDAQGKSRKPIPRGLILPHEALVAGLLMIALMLILLLPLPPLALIFSLVYLALGQGYNLGLKSTPLSGIVFALTMPLIPLYAFAGVGRSLPFLFWLAPVGFLLGVALNLANSLPDVEEDAAGGASTLAVAPGVRRSFLLCQVSILFAPGITKALLTACEMGVFDALSAQPLSLDALAQRLDCQPQGLSLLLNLLISAGYLRYRGGLYRNSRMARHWLTSKSPTSIAPYILHSPDIVAIWEHMPEVVRSNQQAIRMPYEEDATRPEVQATLARHYAGLAALALVLGGEIVNRIRVPQNATGLLDVGGSHAAYSILFCRKHPALQATILDIQPGIEAGQRMAKQTNMTDRLSFLRGDIVRDDFSHAIPLRPSKHGWKQQVCAKRAAIV